MHSTDPLLIEQAQANDSTAWRALVRTYAPAIYTSCRRMGLAADEAPDVVQDVLASVYQSLGRFRYRTEDDGFRKWLNTLTRNRVYDHLRRLGDKQHLAEGGSEAQSRLQRILDRSAPSDDTQSNEAIRLVRRALTIIQRDFEQRTWDVFVATAIHGRSASDVARENGMTPEGVRQAKSRVMKRLREELRA